MPQEKTPPSANQIQYQEVRLPEVLSESDFKVLAERFSAADVKTVQLVLSDERSQRVRTVFNGRERPDGSVTQIGVFELMRLIEKSSAVPRSFNGVLQKVIFAQATLERELGEFESSHDQGASTEDEDKLHNLLEQLAVLLLFENWLNAVASQAGASQPAKPASSHTQDGVAAKAPEPAKVEQGAELAQILQERISAAEALLEDEVKLGALKAEISQIGAIPANPDDPQSWLDLEKKLAEKTLAYNNLKTAIVLDPNHQAEIVQAISNLQFSKRHIATSQNLSPLQSEKVWQLAGGEDAPKLNSFIGRLGELKAEGGALPPLVVEIENLLWMKNWGVNKVSARKYLKVSQELEQDQSRLFLPEWPQYLSELAAHVKDLRSSKEMISEAAAAQLDGDILNKLQEVLVAAQSKYAEAILANKNVVFPGFDQLEVRLTTFESLQNQPTDEAGYKQEATRFTAEIDALWKAFSVNPDFNASLLGPQDIEIIRAATAQALKNRLQVADANRQSRRAEQTSKRDQALSQAAYGSAAKFFEQGYAAAYIPNYENLQWVEQTPEKLASSVFNYVRDVIMEGQTSKDAVFVKMNIFDYSIDIGGNVIKLSTLVEQFSNLGLLYPENVRRDKVAKFKELAGALSIDFGSISKIYELGNAVHEKLKSGSSVLEWLKEDKKSVLGAVSFRRMFAVGEQYWDPAEGKPWGRQLFYALQIYLIQNEPTCTPRAVLETTNPDEKIYVGNARIKSPITHFPTIIGSRGESTVSQYFQRLLLAKISSGQQPAWESDPEWIQKPGETKGVLAERRLRIGRRYYMKELYGLSETPADADSKPKEKPAADSFYTRALRFIEGDEGALTPEEKVALDKKGGYFPQQMASLLGEYFLLFAKAEGQKKGKGERVYNPVTGKTEYTGMTTLRSGRKMLVVDAKSGPTSEVPFVRGFNPQGYSRKLISDGGGYGSPGPKKNMDKFYGFFQTMLDRYSHVFEGDQSGVTLRDLFLVMDKPVDFASLPFEKIIEVEQDNAPWNKSFDVGLFNNNANVAGLGVAWHNIVKTEQGTEGAVLTFDLQIAEKLKKLSRQGYYLLEQDFGKNLKIWDSKEAYREFRVLELWYEDQIGQGIANPQKPASVDGQYGGNRISVNVTNELWDELIKLRIKPTDRHEIFDGSGAGDLSNAIPTKVIRYAARAKDFMWIPPENYRGMNEYERTVLRESAGDPSRIFVKLYVGNMLIGDISRGDTSGMDAKDARAFQMALSFDYYRSRLPSGVIRTIMQAITGRTYDQKDYEGVGFFTPAEVVALMKEAGVPGGLVLASREFLATIQTLGK